MRAAADARSRYSLRTAVDRVVRVTCVLAALLALVPLFSVLLYIGAEGVRGLSWSFFTNLPAPIGDLSGGMGNAILGTVILVAAASAFSVPLGLLAAIYLSEFGSTNRLGRAVRFCADVVAGVPSIAIGVFAYTTVVLAMGHFSALAGAVALAILIRS